MLLIATRHYHDFDPKTGGEYELRDRMFRTAGGSFALMVAGELPGDPPVEQELDAVAVFEWYRDCPEQIKRVVLSADSLS